MNIRQTGECNAEQLAHFQEHSTYPLSENMKSDYVRDGERLLNSKSMVRSWQNEEIVDDVETRDDPFILECAIRLHHEMSNHEFINPMRVIGEVVGNSEEPLSDSWIEYRIRALIHSNHLAYEGNLQSMRMYKIKVV
nr:DUF3658 domain-containing protein [Oceanobacillus caeni]